MKGKVTGYNPNFYTDESVEKVGSLVGSLARGHLEIEGDASPPDRVVNFAFGFLRQNLDPFWVPHESVPFYRLKTNNIVVLTGPGKALV